MAQNKICLISFFFSLSGLSQHVQPDLGVASSVDPRHSGARLDKLLGARVHRTFAARLQRPATSKFSINHLQLRLQLLQTLVWQKWLLSCCSHDFARRP